MRLPDSRARAALLTLLVLALVGASVWVQLFSWPRASFDITAYWEAGVRMRAGGDHIYAPPSDPLNKVGPYLYPPLFAALFAPITLLPRAVGYPVWGALVALSTVLAWRALAWCCRVPAERRRDWTLLVLATLFAAVFVNTTDGQVNLFVLACVAAGLGLIDRERAGFGGALLALAAHLKVLPIALLPVLLVQRRWRAAGAMTVALMLWSAVPAVWMGKGTLPMTVYWSQEMLRPGLATGRFPTPMPVRAPNNSLSAVATRYFTEGRRLTQHSRERSPLVASVPGKVPARAGLALALGLYLLALWRARRDDLVLASGLALAAAVLGNALAWTHHFCFFGLALGAFFARVRAGPWPGRVLVIGLLLLLLPATQAGSVLDGAAIWGAPTLGALLLWAIVARSTPPTEEQGQQEQA